MGRAKSFFVNRTKTPSNLLSLLRALKIAQKGLNKTIKIQFIQRHLHFFIINMTIILKSDYSNKLTGLLGLKFLK